MTSISKNVYIDKLGHIVNKYNNTCHTAIKIKTAIAKSSTSIDFSKEINDEDPKFKISDIVRTSNQNIKPFLQKTMFQIGLKKFLSLKRVSGLLLEYVISDLKG